MEKRIQDCLDGIERGHDVAILYAAESGSRAWGFPSPDSDYDVRFVYVHRQSQYLSIAEPRDVIELPVDALLDANGWDLRKALGLFRKSNAPLYEWLASPIVCRRDARFFDAISALVPDYFSPRAGCHHYLSMARNACETGLRGERVRLKKYFYALRPLLAAGWILRHGGVPPMDFEPLRSMAEDDLVDRAIDELLRQKTVSDESVSIPPVAVLDDFIAARLAAYTEASARLQPHCGDVEPLNRLFRSFLLP